MPPPRKRKLTRKDYESLIKMGKKRGGGNVLPETVMLAHLMSSANRNVKQRQAVVDSLNENQVRHVGKLLKKVLNTKRKLPKNQIKQLIRDRNLINALIKGQGTVSTRKKILKLKTKNQKGGFLGALLPVAMSLAGPAIKGLGKVFESL